jgi:hypothetical protein
MGAEQRINPGYQVARKILPDRQHPGIDRCPRLKNPGVMIAVRGQMTTLADCPPTPDATGAVIHSSLWAAC